MSEDPRRIRYREAVNRLKVQKQGTPEWQKNADIIKSIGGTLGLNWQNDLPKSFSSTPGKPTVPTNTAPTTPAANAPYTPPDKIERAAAETKFKEAANRIKGLQVDSPEWSKNAEILRTLGSKFGWSWQDNLPKGYTGPTAPAAQTPTPETPAKYAYNGYQPGDEVIVRKGLSGVQLSPEEGRRFQQISYYDLIPNASTPAERKNLSLKASQSIYAYGQAEGVPDPKSWGSAAINNPNILPPNFDPEAYIQNNPDLAAAGVDPVQHFLDNGIFENRVFTKDGKRTGEYFSPQGDWRPPATTNPTEQPPTNGNPATGEQPPPSNSQPKIESPLDRALLDKAIQNLMPAQDPAFHEGSALYNFQKGEGLKSLERLMSARGLTGSGAEVEGNAKFLNQLGAEEADRQREYNLRKDQLRSAASQYVLGLDADNQRTAANLAATYRGQDQGFLNQLLGLGLDSARLNNDVDQRNADRAVTVADSTARNNLQASSNALNSLINYINSGYSQSPMDNAMDAAAGIGSNYVNYGQDSSKITQNLYARPTGYARTGGGGGGYGYTPVQAAPYMPPSMRPSAPNMSVPNMIGIFGGAANNTGYLNAANSFLGGMFSGGSKAGGGLW